LAAGDNSHHQNSQLHYNQKQLEPVKVPRALFMQPVEFRWLKRMKASF
jgi:hypothetical protein